MEPVYKYTARELFLPVDGYTHIVQTLVSINGGQTFYFWGRAHYFHTEAEALAFIEAQEEGPAAVREGPLEEGPPIRKDAQEEPTPGPIREEPPELEGIFYLFDCMDGALADQLLTPQEISRRLYGEARELTEADIKGIAADYEAELYRYTYKNGQRTEGKRLTRLI